MADKRHKPLGMTSFFGNYVYSLTSRGRGAYLKGIDASGKIDGWWV